MKNRRTESAVNNYLFDGLNFNLDMEFVEERNCVKKVLDVNETGICRKVADINKLSAIFDKNI